MQFRMLSVICFNLDQSKILSSGNGLNKRAKMALDGSSEFLRGPKPIFFFYFGSFEEVFLRISLCPKSASSPHSPEPCLLMDQNSVNNF